MARSGDPRSECLWRKEIVSPRAGMLGTQIATNPRLEFRSYAQKGPCLWRVHACIDPAEGPRP